MLSLLGLRASSWRLTVSRPILPAVSRALRIFAVLLLGLHLGLTAPACTANPARTAPAEESAKVVWVHDGDTVTVRIGPRKEKVRLIGIDTTELDAEGPWSRDLAYSARDYARGRIKGRQAILRKDPLTSDRDKYGRLLRYVILPDGTNFNEEMIRKGYARAYTRFRFSLSREFRSAESEARGARVGRWARSPDTAR